MLQTIAPFSRSEEVEVRRAPGGWEVYQDGRLVARGPCVTLSHCSGFTGFLCMGAVPDPLSRGRHFAEFQKNGAILRW